MNTLYPLNIVQQINEVIKVEICLNFYKFNLDDIQLLVLVPLNRTFPFRKSKRILKVWSIIEFIFLYTLRMQALHNFGQCNNLYFPLLHLIFVRLIIVLFYLRSKILLFFKIHSISSSSISSNSYSLCHDNWQVVLKSLRNNLKNGHSWGEDKSNMHQLSQNFQEYMK